MSRECWIFQRPEQLRDMGEEQAPWYVGWYEPDGRRKAESCGPGFRGKQKAERLRKKIDAELMTGTYQKNSSKLWADFIAEYERRVVAGLAPRSRGEVMAALRHFERIVKPIRIFAISTGHVDDFIARRREEQGFRKGVLISPATVNKDLRHLKAALRVAFEWGYLPVVPRFRMEKEPKKLPTYLPPEDFAKVYAACAVARFPAGIPYPAADWWRGLLVTAYMTGWRIGQLLALRRDDVDLDAGTAFSRAADNKGKRDVLIPLHPVIVDHLRRIPGFSPVFFPWNHARRMLFMTFQTIQDAADVRPDRKDRYGFHDLRRAFATLNADRLTPDVLQAMMQHQDYQTTQRYINMARQMKPATHNLFVPELGKQSETGS